MQSSLPSGGALAGLRVVDLTQMLAAPFCTSSMAPFDVPGK
ncbi:MULTISPECIES: hypothetical protein [Cupriavidus]